MNYKELLVLTHHETIKNKENWLEIKDLIIDRLEIYLYDYFVRDKLYE